MKKSGFNIFFVFLLVGVFLVNFGSAFICYQESANTINQTGIDGSCGLNYTGNYLATANYFYMNYSVPSGFISATWKVKHGTFGEYNVSIPSECINNSIVPFRVYASGITSYGQCFNYTLQNWITITNISVPPESGSCMLIDPTNWASRIYDGDFNTRALYTAGGWKTPSSGNCLDHSFYEEAIFWNFSYFPVYNCQVLDQPNTVYSLQNDVFSGSICFNITADNVTLEGNGHAINGSFGNSDTYAVYSKSARNISVRNLTIDSFADDTYCTNCGAINFTNVSYSLISDIFMTNNAHGIRLRDSTYNFLRNINFSFPNPGSGISAVWIKYSNHNYLNNLTSNGEISFDNSVNNTLYGSYIYGDSLFSGERNSTIKNTLLSGGSIGISDSDYVPSGNLFENNTIYAPAGFESIIISTGGFIMNNTFLNNNLYSNVQSIFLFDNSNPQINPLIYNNSFGQIIWKNTSALYNNNYGIIGNITFPGNIQITNNSVYVNSAALPELNVSANITFYNLPTNMRVPKIMKDGAVCTSCYNFTSLNAGNVTFNVSSWSNYTVQDASQLSACGSLSIANTVYTLQNDVSTTGTCFSITADNITLNLNGYNITGGNNAGYFGISSSNRRNITILNGVIERFGKASGGSYGIYFSNTSNSNISNIILSNNFNGLYLLAASNNNTFSNITSNYNNYSGVYIISSLNNRLYNITTLNNNYGVDLESSSNNNSFYNVVSANNQNEGITLSSSSNNNFSYVTAYNNSASVYFMTSSNNLFTESDISNSSWGVYIYLSSSNNLFYNLNSYSNTNQEIVISASTGSKLIYNNSFGEIRLKALTSSVEGDLRFGVGRNIQLSTSSAYINSTALPGLNLSANITLNNTGYDYPQILKDGVICSAPSCNLLSSSGTNHTFNVSSWSNYTIAENTVISSCRDLTSANTVYTLQNNISTNATCFNIGANNITLNLNGYTVNGSNGATYYGIYSNNYNSTSIKNGTIQNFGRSFNGVGVYLLYGNNNTLSDLALNNNGYGFYLEYVANSTFYNLSATSHLKNGVLISYGESNFFYNCNFSYNSKEGIFIIDSLNNHLYNPTAMSNISKVLRFDSGTNNSLIYTNSYGQGVFPLSATITHELFYGIGSPIQIANNSMYLNSTAIPELNISANITFYGLQTKVSEMYNASVLFNEGNGRMSCANCTLLNSSDSDSSVTFNVSDFGNSRNYSVGGVDVVPLNVGWNSLSFILDNVLISSRNISVSVGWNLIGFASNESVNTSLINFTNSSGITYNWNAAVIAGKVMNDVYSYNSPLKSFEISNNLNHGNGYWFYAREAGNLTIPSISGSEIGETYSLSDLAFVNSSGIQNNITNADASGWINISRIYGYGSATNFTALDYQLNSSDSWKGYMFWSNQNLSLLRQD